MPVVVKVVSYLIITEDTLSEETYKNNLENKPLNSREVIEFSEELFENHVSELEDEEGPEVEPRIEEIKWIDADEVQDFRDSIKIPTPEGELN